MPTLVAFSARKGDAIVVEGDIQEISDKLSPGNRPGSGLCTLTHIPGKLQMHFDPTPVMVNPERVAYIRAVNE